MSNFHSFDSLDPATRAIYPETQYQGLSCRPFQSFSDGEVTRYPRLLSRWTCPKCGAVWQFDQVGFSADWRLIALPDPQGGQAMTDRTYVRLTTRGPEQRVPASHVRTEEEQA